MSSDILGAIALAIPLFAITNVDDIFVLLGFFSDKRFRTREVLWGQFAGISMLIAASVVAALIALVLPPAYIGLLGLAPIAIGLYKLYKSRSAEAEGTDEAPEAKGFGLANVLAVLTVTVANGGDNIGVYAPVFALRSYLEIGVIVVTFLVMTALWCILAFWMVNHPQVGAPIRKYGQRLLPYVLIIIGCLVLYEAGTIEFFLTGKTSGH